MTVVRPNSISGINSITVATGEALSIHGADGALVSTLTNTSGIATYKGIHVGSGTTTSNQGVIVGTGASIVSDAVNELSIYTNNSERLLIDSVGRHGINVTNIGDYYSAADDLVIKEKDGGDTGITLRTGTANSGLICFADGASSTSDQYRRGQIRYHHNSDSMDFTTAGNTARITIDSSGLIANNARVPSSYGSPNLLISGTDSTLTLMGDGQTNSTSYTGIKFRVAGASSGDYTKAGIFSRREGGYNDLSLIVAMDTAADANSVAISDEKMRITSAGRVGIATDTPGAYLDIGDNLGSVPGFHLRNHPAAAPFEDIYLAEIRHAYGSVKHACLIHAEEANDGRRSLDVSDSNGIFATFTNHKVGINTEIPGRYLHIVGNDGPTQATIGNSDTQLVIDNKGSNGAMMEFLSDTNGAGRIYFTDTAATNQGGIVYSHASNNMQFTTGGSVRMTVGSQDGSVYSGNQPSGEVAVSSSDSTQTGCTLNAGGSNSYHIMASNAHPTLYMCRRTSDGVFVEFYQDTGKEGTISVSGSTVSYNGGHLSRWSQLDGISATDKSSRPTIYQGTVMSNLDKLCEWKHPDVLYKDGDVIPDGKSIGDVKEAAHTEDNQQLNMTKVSDTVGDKDVAGVFWTWDDEDDEYVNDFYVAMTGDMVIRVAGSVTVARGDLMESAGDGTAKPQSDDIIRSKTIAKIASNIATATYADGSKAYPCALMAC